MGVNKKPPTILVSFRLPRELVERIRRVSGAQQWPPPPTMREIVARGAEIVLETLEKRPSR